MPLLQEFQSGNAKLSLIEIEIGCWRGSKAPPRHAGVREWHQPKNWLLDAIMNLGETRKRAGLVLVAARCA